MGSAPLSAWLPRNHWQYNVRRPFSIVENRLQGRRQIVVSVLPNLLAAIGIRIDKGEGTARDVNANGVPHLE